MDSDHFERAWYGDFELTDAIRPDRDLSIIPVQGYRKDMVQIDEGRKIPMITAAITRSKLFDVFMDSLELFDRDALVDVVLETSHDTKKDAHRDLFREEIDLPVLKGYLDQYADLLINDGCAGVAVLGETDHGELEVQLEEHKLLTVYQQKPDNIMALLRGHGIPFMPRIKFLRDGEHFHSTDAQYRAEFVELATALGIDDDLSSILDE